MTGTIGFWATFAFVRMIYSALKGEAWSWIGFEAFWVAGAAHAQVLTVSLGECTYFSNRHVSLAVEHCPLVCMFRKHVRPYSGGGGEVNSRITD